MVAKPTLVDSWAATTTTEVASKTFAANTIQAGDLIVLKMASTTAIPHVIWDNVFLAIKGVGAGAFSSDGGFGVCTVAPNAIAPDAAGAGSGANRAVVYSGKASGVVGTAVSFLLDQTNGDAWSGTGRRWSISIYRPPAGYEFVEATKITKTRASSVDGAWTIVRTVQGGGVCAGAGFVGNRTMSFDGTTYVAADDSGNTSNGQCYSLLYDYNDATATATTMDVSGTALTGTNAVAAVMYAVSRIPTTVGRLTETDSVRAVKKQINVGQITETDSVQTVRPSHTLPVGQMIVTSSLSPIVPSKSRTVGQMTETDEFRSITRGIATPVGQMSETDSIRSVTPSKSQAVGRLEESTVMRSITPSKSVPVGRLTETDSMRSITKTPPWKFYGDSITTNSTSGIQDELIEIFDAAGIPSTRYAFDATAGFRSDQQLADVQAGAPVAQILYVNLGTNDLGYYATPTPAGNPSGLDAALTNLLAAMDTCPNPIIVVTVGSATGEYFAVLNGYTGPPLATRWNNALKAWAASRPRVAVIDWYAEVAIHPEYFNVDFVHPTEAGADWLAAQVWAAINSIKRIAVGRLTETLSMGTVVPSKRGFVGRLTESNAFRSLIPSKSRTVGRIEELDSIGPISATRPLGVRRMEETNSMRSITPVKGPKPIKLRVVRWTKLRASQNTRIRKNGMT